MLVYADTTPPPQTIFRQRRSHDPKRDIPPLPLDVRERQTWFSVCLEDRLLVREMIDGNPRRRLYASGILDSHRVIGNRCYALMRAGEIFKREAVDAITEAHLCTRRVARRRIKAMVSIGLWELRNGVLRHTNWDKANVPAEMMAQRIAEQRAKGREKKRAQRAKKGPRMPLGRPKKITIPGTSKCVPCIGSTAAAAPPAEPRPSALRPALRCARVRYGGGARAPWTQRYARLQKAPPPRPFTDTELDALADELDAETERLARRTENLAGDPPAAPGPQPAKSTLAAPMPEETSPMAFRVPRIFTDGGDAPEAARPLQERAEDHAAAVAPTLSGNPATAILAALERGGLAGLAAAMETEPASSPAPVAPEAETSVSSQTTGNPNKPKNCPIARAVSDVSPKAGPPASVRSLRCLQREHRLEDCPVNLVAMARDGITYDVARRSFALYAEAQARARKGLRAKVVNPGAFILGTARRLHGGWTSAP